MRHTAIVLTAGVLSACAVDCAKSTAGWNPHCGFTHQMGTNTQTQGYLTQAEQEAASLESQARSAQARRDSMKLDMAKTRRELAALQDLSAPLRKQAQAIQEELSQAQRELADLELTRNRLQAELTELEATKQSSKNQWDRRQELIAELRETQASISRLDQYIERSLLSRAQEILRNAS